MNMLTTKIQEKSTNGSVAIHENEIVELQDCIARMTEFEIEEMWAELSESERSTFIWIVFKVESYDGAMSILKYTAVTSLCQEYVDIETKVLREAADAENEARIQAERKAREMTVCNVKLGKQIAELEGGIEASQKGASEGTSNLARRNRELETQVKKLAELVSAHETILRSQFTS